MCEWIDENRFYGVSEMVEYLGMGLFGTNYKGANIDILLRIMRVVGMRKKLVSGGRGGRKMVGLYGRDFKKLYAAWREFEGDLMLYAWKGTASTKIKRFLNGGGL